MKVKWHNCTEKVRTQRPTELQTHTCMHTTHTHTPTHPSFLAFQPRHSPGGRIKWQTLSRCHSATCVRTRQRVLLPVARLARKGPLG